MQMKRMMAAALCLLLACSLLVQPAAAADFGAHTANVVVSYTNPDTGEIDDAGGSANAALGEGMCISATGKTALVETDRSGNTWVTIRLLMQSNCSDIRFAARVGYNQYQEIGYIESGYGMDGDDSVDYRMNVWSEDTIFKCTMFVGPMGRDAVWYLYLDTGSLESGSGDFNVMIDLNEPAPTEEATEEATRETVEETTEPAVSPTKTPDEPEKKPTEAPTVPETPEQVETSAARDPAAPTETTASTAAQPGETTAPQAAQPGETRPAATKPGETEAMTTAPADTSAPSKSTAPAEKEEAKEEIKEEKSGFPLWGWATVIILILCAAGGIGFYVYMNKDKHHEK